MSEETKMIMQAITELQQGMITMGQELRQEFRQEIAELRQEMNERFDHVDRRLDYQVAKLSKLEEEQHVLKEIATSSA
ncbi:hypothetical protein [Bacillus horti]|uniref:Archaellum component FlaC n=1 Tax=Caldalkalibacillus horti TaxID=77523 RepID=A0ABT9VZB3_9BACI|nr:hypothetical protein [Bacillus horti]MDQ0166319.1 archaellum component FlaC [Bacillus horti]